MIDHPAYDWIKNGDTDSVRAWFNDHPADFNANIADGFTPVQVAAMHGQVAMVEFFLDRAVLVNKTAANASLTTTLHLATSYRKELKAREMIEILVANGAELGAQDANGETPLHLAAGRASEELISALIQLGADPFMKTLSGLTVGQIIDHLPIDLANLDKKQKLRELLKAAFSLPLE